MPNLFFSILTTILISAASSSLAQEPDARKDVIVLDKDTPLKREASVTYIGEIKGRTYVKIIFEQLAPADGSGLIPVRGTCYEAASGKTYPVSGTIDSENGIWNLKCLNNKKQTIYTFTGREDFEGTIEGNWKSRHTGLSFYLFKKEQQGPL